KARRAIRCGTSSRRIFATASPSLRPGSTSRSWSAWKAIPASAEQESAPPGRERKTPSVARDPAVGARIEAALEEAVRAAQDRARMAHDLVVVAHDLHLVPHAGERLNDGGGEARLEL